MSDIGKRTQRVVESLYENEALREHLQDTEATVLFDWMVGCVEQIVQRTADIDDDDVADEAMAPRLKAIRQFMRVVNELVAYSADMTTEEQTHRVTDLVHQATLFYGEAWMPPDQAQQTVFLERLLGDITQPVQLIHTLQQLLAGTSLEEK